MPAPAGKTTSAYGRNAAFGTGGSYQAGDYGGCIWQGALLSPSFSETRVCTQCLSGEEPGSYTETVRRLIERENPDLNERNVLVSHQFYTAAGQEPVRSDSEAVFVGGSGNVDISAVSCFDYVAMGHIHKKQCVGERSSDIAERL